MNRPTSRPGNENHLLIQTLSPAARSPLLALVKRIADCGCNLVDARVSTVGSDVSVMLLAQGSWDAVAKLETSLGKLARDDELQITHYRTTPRSAQSHLLPYVVEVIAGDKAGVLVEIIEFFTHRGISVEQLASMRYRAMQTGADMFSAQITVGIPSDTHIAALRDDFLELCDGLNLDAIMDPMKY